MLRLLQTHGFYLSAFFSGNFSRQEEEIIIDKSMKN